MTSSDENTPVEADVNLAILTLLMRIYDQNMALLRVQGESGRMAAKDLFDLHQQGQTLNPDIWLAGE